MHASRTVCSTCASKIRSVQIRSLGGAALFASMSDDASNASSSSIYPNVASSVTHGRAAEAPRRQSRGSGWRAPRRDHSRPFNGPSSYTKKKPLRPSEDSAIALFKDVVSPETKGAVSQPSPLGELEIAAKIKELSAKNVDALEKLQVFRTSISPHLDKFRGQLPKQLLSWSTKFLDSICDEIARRGYTGHGVELSLLYSSLGKTDLDVRNQLVLNVCRALIFSKRNLADRGVLLNELTGLWQHISQLGRWSQQHQPLRFAFPPFQDVQQDIAKRKAINTYLDPTTRALAALFLQHSPDEARDIMPALLATLAVLSDPGLVEKGTLVTMDPLLSPVAVALGNREVATESYVSRTFDDRVRFPSEPLSEIQSYVVQQWPQVTKMIHNRSSSSSSLAALHGRLRSAQLARDPSSVYAIWEDFSSLLERQPEFANQLHSNAEFLDFWIFVWCANRSARHLQETFDLMRRLRIHPTLKTYTGMMHGWKICKDTDRIDALWLKLASSGQKLDAHIWTERISSLIEAGKPQAGLEALAEMLALWKQAVQKKVPQTAVQPTIEAVNAAFKGIIQVDRRAAFEVLEWASRAQIQPNIRTYNILIRHSFRDDSPDEVQTLLKVMSQHGIEPDAATFTIILEEVIGRMGTASAADQVEAVQLVFQDMQRAGLRPNPETYGKMLYAVSSLANGSEEAIAAVLVNMRADGFKITPHMVTILIERALRRDPPDMAAVDALLVEHDFSHVSQGDQTLWERVMSANAITGNTERAMAAFDNLQKAGRPVTSLPCLTDLLWALLSKEKHDEARRVVDVVLDFKTRDGDWDGDSRDERYWRHHFWFLAYEGGLLDRREVPDVLRASLRM